MSRRDNIIMTGQGQLKVSCHNVSMASFGEKMVFGTRLLVGAKSGFFNG